MFFGGGRTNRRILAPGWSKLHPYVMATRCSKLHPYVKATRCSKLHPYVEATRCSKLLPYVVAAACCFSFFPSTALAQEPASVDSRWLPWFGCWRPSEQRAPEQGADVCVVPSGTNAVRMVTLAGDQTVVEETVAADGTARITDEGACHGTRRAEWSRDGERLYSSAELTCNKEPARKVSGLTLITAQSEWLHVLVQLRRDVRLAGLVRIGLRPVLRLLFAVRLQLLRLLRIGLLRPWRRRGHRAIGPNGRSAARARTRRQRRRLYASHAARYFGRWQIDLVARRIVKCRRRQRRIIRRWRIIEWRVGFLRRLLHRRRGGGDRTKP